MEDASIDFAREEILEKFKLFGINACTSINTAALRVKLRNLVKIHHPIHSYISQLTQDEVRNIYFIIFPTKKRQIADRMRTSIANEFFKNFPSSPLVALKFCVENGKVPEMNNLKQAFESYGGTKSTKSSRNEKHTNCKTRTKIKETKIFK